MYAILYNLWQILYLFRNNFHILCFLSFFSVFLLCFIRFQCLHGDSGHRIKHNNIKNRHQSDSDISKIPYEGIRCDSANKQHDKCQYLICGLPDPFITEKVRHIASCIKQDAQKSRKTE